MTRTLKTLVAAAVMMGALATTRAAAPEPRRPPARHRIADEGCREQPVLPVMPVAATCPEAP